MYSKREHNSEFQPKGRIQRFDYVCTYDVYNIIDEIARNMRNDGIFSTLAALFRIFGIIVEWFNRSDSPFECQMVSWCTVYVRICYLVCMCVCVCLTVADKIRFMRLYLNYLCAIVSQSFHRNKATYFGNTAKKMAEHLSLETYVILFVGHGKYEDCLLMTWYAKVAIHISCRRNMCWFA